jgi:hypothetical protein
MLWFERPRPVEVIRYETQPRLSIQWSWSSCCTVRWNLTQFWWAGAAIDWPGFRLRLGPLFVVWWWNRVQYGFMEGDICIHLHALPGDRDVWVWDGVTPPRRCYPPEIQTTKS